VVVETTAEARLGRLVSRVQRGAEHVQHEHVIVAEVQLVPLVPVALRRGSTAASPVSDGGNEPPQNLTYSYRSRCIA